MGIFPMKRRFSRRWNRKNPICCCLVSARRGRSSGWRETGGGGLLDVFAGDIPRAPESWQRLGLEWLYRLLREPKRLRRMIRLPKILLLAARERK